jgi:3-carboxy-cis,cis-muconate cycloisomerase
LTSASPSLLAPGADGAPFSNAAVLRALVDVESAYLRALVAAGIAPSSVGSLAEVELPDAEAIATAARETGNPIIPLLTHLKSRVDADTAEWLHRGATSQDIVDSALVLLVARARPAIDAALAQTIAALARLADEHRGTVAAARTLTQHSTPTTLGLRFATWLSGVLDARDALAATPLPAQLGGASGTLAALVEVAGAERAAAVPAAFAEQLGLAAASPWHSSRTPITRIGDALCGVTDALGMVAANVLTLARTEIGELAEPVAEGRGGSSAMPQKRNPVLSVLIRGNALRAPGLLSTLHSAAALSVDERADGAWHAEWATLGELVALASGSASLAAELSAGLTVDTERVAANLAMTGDGILAERASISGTTGSPADYLGLSDRIIDTVLARAS